MFKVVVKMAVINTNGQKAELTGISQYESKEAAKAKYTELETLHKGNNNITVVLI